MKSWGCYIYLLLLIFSVTKNVVNCVTNPNDFKILDDFRNGLENSELLKWPANGNDPCGTPAWPHVFCSNGRVTQIQVQGLGLKGPLPQNLNQLDKLWNVGMQNNKFNGKLPSFSGLSSLQYAYLDFNEFDSIPGDFFDGLSDVRVLALDGNMFNQNEGGWRLPSELGECSQLVNFSCSNCNVVGEIPDFFGRFSSLSLLRLAYNKLSGGIPSSFRDSMLQVLWLNNQDGGGMSGSIEVIGSMVGLTEVWLHGNRFSGKIPDSIGDLTSLRELNLNSNSLVGLIPSGLANLNLRLLNLNNNMFMGPIPKFKATDVSYDSNSFCQSKPGDDCAPEVTALLDFLHDLDYPERLASQWTGNDPCTGPWWGITCDASNQVSVINLQNIGLNGTLSPSLVNLSSLFQIHLERNNLHGIVPSNITLLRSLRLLNLSGNDFEPPLPRFHDGVKVITDDNPKLVLSKPTQPPSPSVGPPLSSPPTDSPGSGSKYTPTESPKAGFKNPPNDSPESGFKNPPPNDDGSTGKGLSSSPPSELAKPEKKSSVLIIVAAAAGSTCFTILAVLLALFCLKKRKRTKAGSSGVVIHPNNSSSDDSGTVKIAVVHNFSALEKAQNSSAMSSWTTDGVPNAQAIDKQLIISLQVLQKATNAFSQENEIGRGGFGVVYKGELEDGSKLAVKRMESTAVSNKALDEFQAEIAVLSSVRQRHLVSLFGFSIEGNERLLVYEYMPKGALSQHLFRWKSLNLEPLSWTRRLIIALDVARGVEYLHSLAHRSFIHRDLKSANILLDDDFRAKVSDFGLVKLAPDRERSVATRLAGTFGYLAPEYAVTGKISTKVDVFSFGVVLMELLTGLIALDEQRPEEKRYLAEWFWQIKSNKETLIASVDPALDAKEEIHESIYMLAELAGHCTTRDPNHRPDMGHAVNVLSQLVEKWSPFSETEQYSGINLMLPLPQQLKGWQEEGGDSTKEYVSGVSGVSGDSEGSIPGKPSGFADSFTSADAR